MSAIIFLLLLTPSDAPKPDFAKTFKDAQEYVMGVAEKMPMWDADKLGQFERDQIALVKADILAAQKETDPDKFLIDVQKLRDDAESLQALDDSVVKESVI